MVRKVLAAVAAVLAVSVCCALPAGAAWQKEEQNWIYQNNSGICKGWLLDRGNWYYLDPSTGIMQTGWKYVDGHWYYLSDSGAMCTGWRKIAGKWYLFNSSGEMQTGIVHDGQSWYYLDDSGAWTEDDPEEHTAISATGKTISLRNGLCYVDGILIANKSYPLPSSYAPGGLTADTMTAFQTLQKAMQQQGLSIWVSSGYRSYSYQDGLYQRYVNRDGKAAADRYSARAGYSEHQTGLAFDVNQINDSFANTPEAKWLADHAHEYGFIIRYPKGKEPVTGYQYEPWHLRYLGIETATAVYQSGLSLEEYLGIESRYIR